AKHLEVTSSCGHRYAGADRAGAVSFVPAHCERRLRLLGVSSEWASISLNPALLDRDAHEDAAKIRSLESAIFTNGEDPFIAGLVTEVARLRKIDGGLDATYCDAMSWALAQYLARRYGEAVAASARDWRLPPWRLHRITDYIETHLSEEIRIIDLAELVGVSPGYLHRAFRATTGRTPLAFINDRRIRRALQIMTTESASIAEIALRSGFMSPSHFSRIFRRITGINPAAYRKGRRSSSGR
ncbi:MAG: AraC family transcriptional regulator, partial [Dongiaceae bacterium]